MNKYQVVFILWWACLNWNSYVKIFFSLEKQALIEVLQIIGLQNQLPISFGTALVFNKMFNNI